MDLSHYMDTFRATPPAMFPSRHHLACWIETSKLAVEEVPGSAGNILRVHGAFDDTLDVAVPYSQLWARADYENYRNPWATHHSHADAVDVKKLTSLNADHVINKARVLTNYPQAWVMLFPVQSGSNTRFGGSIERFFPPLSPGIRDGYLIDGLVGFKIFSAEYPRTQFELDAQLDSIAGQVPTWFHHQVESMIRQVFVPTKVSSAAIGTRRSASANGTSTALDQGADKGKKAARRAPSRSRKLS